MMGKENSSYFKACLAILLLLGLFVSGCKKEPEQAPAGNGGSEQTNGNGDGESGITAQNTGSVAANLVPLPIVPPKAMYIGTKQDNSAPNLEKQRLKPRGPFPAPEGTINVAAGKAVSCSSQEILINGELEMITDGDKEASDGSFVELAFDLQYVTIDLEAEYDIYAVLFWHFHKQAWVYFDVVVQISNDPDFIDAVTIFNNDIDNSAGLGTGTDKHYVETNEGKLVDAKGRRGRYVRLYSNGNTDNAFNNYIEVEVFGKPVK